ncbi:hypothetical protein MW887_005452 [Aspergillus wentii]|nr:hypothetical protein MW887_005452 [Aspergillus wentii]
MYLSYKILVYRSGSWRNDGVFLTEWVRLVQCMLSSTMMATADIGITRNSPTAYATATANANANAIQSRICQLPSEEDNIASTQFNSP